MTPFATQVGQGLAAYIVPAANGSGLHAVDSGDLRRFVLDTLPEYMAPTLYVPLEALPRSRAGKLDRKRLPPPREERTTAMRGRSPQTPLESRIAAAFCEVLQRTEVGADENFFEIGGHSLLAMQVFNRLQDQFPGGHPPVQAFYQRPTVAGLAETILAQQLELQSDDSREALLQRLEELTDDQVQRLLES